MERKIDKKYSFWPLISCLSALVLAIAALFFSFVSDSLLGAIIYVILIIGSLIFNIIITRKILKGNLPNKGIGWAIFGIVISSIVIFAIIIVIVFFILLMSADWSGVFS